MSADTSAKKKKVEVASPEEMRKALAERRRKRMSYEPYPLDIFDAEKTKATVVELRGLLHEEGPRLLGKMLTIIKGDCTVTRLYCSDDRLPERFVAFFKQAPLGSATRTVLRRWLQENFGGLIRAEGDWQSGFYFEFA